MLTREKIEEKIRAFDIDEIIKTALGNYTYCNSHGLAEINVKTGKLVGSSLSSNSYSNINDTIEIFRIDKFTDFDCYEFWVEEQRQGSACGICGRADECEKDCDGYKRYPSNETIISVLSGEECLDWDMIYQNIDEFFNSLNGDIDE